MTPGELAVLLESGLSLQDALGDTSPAEFGESFRLAVDFGAPLVPLLWQLETQRVNLSRAQAELRQALAVPRATRKLLIWLPALSLVFALLMGLTSIGAMLNPLVLLSVAIALGLLLLGSKITRRMLQAAEKNVEVAALQQLQVAVTAGMTVGQIASSTPELTGNPEVRNLLRLSFATGAALESLVRGQIQLSLENQLSSSMEKLRELSVRILIPLGLTTLPAFLLFTIPPILVGSINR